MSSKITSKDSGLGILGDFGFELDEQFQDASWEACRVGRASV